MEGIKYVINFDYPNSSEDYIHRIGRTARSDSTGTSYAFFTPSNYRQAKDLISVLNEANQVINPKLAEMAGRSGGYGGKGGYGNKSYSRWGTGGGNSSRGGGNTRGGGYNRGRENNGPRQTRFSDNTGNRQSNYGNRGSY